MTMLWESYKSELDAICVDPAEEQRFYHAVNKAAIRCRLSFQVQTVVGITAAACVAVAAIGIGLHWFNGGTPPIFGTADSRANESNISESETTKPHNTTGRHPAYSGSTESGNRSTTTISDDSSDAFVKQIPGKFKAMTEEEIAAYLGRKPFPDDLPIPNGLTLVDVPRGIYEGEGVEQILRTQFITYLYTDGTDDPQQTLEITVAKGRLPKLDGWELGKPTTINGTTVHWYIYDDRPHVGNKGTIFYNAYILVDKIGYSVVTQNLSEEDFWTVVKAIA